MGDPLPCPTCKRARDAEGRCWQCHDRSCARCGRPTGSAFIRLCIGCGTREDAAPEPPEPERWALAFTPIGDGPPMAVRMRRLIKYAYRALGLRYDHVPDPPAPADPKPTPAEQRHDD